MRRMVGPWGTWRVEEGWISSDRWWPSWPGCILVNRVARRGGPRGVQHLQISGGKGSAEAAGRCGGESLG